MLYSQLELSIPEQIDENTDFTDIFGGVILSFRKKVEYPSFSHASLLPSAVDFFKNKTAEGVNPIDVLEESLTGTGPFIPGCSILSIPYEDLLNFYISDVPMDREFGSLIRAGVPLTKMDPLSVSELMGKGEILKKLRMDHIFWITEKERDEEGKGICLAQIDYDRAFAQIITGGLEAAMEKGFKGVVRVPSFANRTPNYFERVRLNYQGEGLQRGVIVIDGDVGDCLGKHSDGGSIVVKGGAGEYTGDVSSKVSYYIGGDVDSITQVRNCEFYIKGHVNGKIQGERSEFHLSRFLLGMDGRYGLGSYFAPEVTKRNQQDQKEKLEQSDCTLVEWDEDVESKYDGFLQSLEK